MCIQSTYIYNKYINQSVLVDCGKCEACLQKKAVRRSNRIRNNVRDGEMCLFVTLTYPNQFVPYVDKRDLRYGSNWNIPIRRHCRGRFVRSGSSYLQEFSKTPFSLEGYIEDYIPYSSVYKHDFSIRNENRLRSLVGRSENEIGVCYYLDVQNFFKRLRQNLNRNYNYEESFSYFSCSEYGPTTGRPHYHLLIFFPREKEREFRNSIVKSWPYADKGHGSVHIEEAFDCASYVSSYVNGHFDFPSLLSGTLVRSKHSYSKSFGLGLSSFSLRSILEKIERGNLTYRVVRNSNGTSTPAELPIPKYVVNRFFPKFKGYSRLSPDSLDRVLSRPANLAFVPECHEIGYTLDDYHRICVALTNSINNFCEVTGLNHQDYIIAYKSAWSLYFSATLKESYKDISSVMQLANHYENLSTLNIREAQYSKCLTYLLEDTGLHLVDFEFDVNKLSYRLIETSRLSELYRKMKKQRKVTDYVINNNVV